MPSALHRLGDRNPRIATTWHTHTSSRLPTCCSCEWPHPRSTDHGLRHSAGFPSRRKPLQRAPGPPTRCSFLSRQCHRPYFLVNAAAGRPAAGPPSQLPAPTAILPVRPASVPRRVGASRPACRGPSAHHSFFNITSHGYLAAPIHVR